MFKQKEKKGIKGKEIKSYLYLSRKTTRGRGARGKFFLKELEYLFFSWHISSKSFISVTIFNVKRKKKYTVPCKFIRDFSQSFFSQCRRMENERGKVWWQKAVRGSEKSFPSSSVSFVARLTLSRKLYDSNCIHRDIETRFPPLPLFLCVVSHQKGLHSRK